MLALQRTFEIIRNAFSFLKCVNATWDSHNLKGLHRFRKIIYMFFFFGGGGSLTFMGLLSL